MPQQPQQRRQWKDFSPLAKVASIVAGIIQFSLLAAALLDIRRRPSEQVRGPKWAWALVAFINYFGPLSYFLFGRKPAAQTLPPSSGAGS